MKGIYCFDIFALFILPCSLFAMQQHNRPHNAGIKKQEHEAHVNMAQGLINGLRKEGMKSSEIIQLVKEAEKTSLSRWKSRAK